MAQLIPPPLTLYIHFPWCVKKCPYCDFNSHQLKQPIDEQAYIDALIADLTQDVPKVWGRTVHAIFMGGGTPSLFSSQSINKLLSAIRALLNCQPAMEVTMEVNPGTGEYDHFVGYKEAGINRISMGVQSLNDNNLNNLGRIHSADQAIEVYHQARSAGFDNINLDMMFGLSGQSLNAAKKDLRALIELKPEHISYYQLTLEANTLFAVKPPPQLPDEDLLEKMYLQGREILHDSGFHQYEVSAYAQKGQTSRHNVNYWQFGDYLGIGAGAHSKITYGAEQVIKRYVKHKLPKKYQSGLNHFIQQEKSLSSQDIQFEFMLNAVRLKAGIKIADFSSRTGLSPSELLKKLEFAINMKWVKYQQDTIELTEKGYLVSDEIVKLML